MEIPRHWRLKAQRYRLEGSTCPNCGQLIFPPRPVFLHCTDKPAQTASRIIPVLLPLPTLTDVKAQIDYRIAERLIA